MGSELEECYPEGAPEGFPAELFAAVPASEDMCVRDLALQQKIEALEDSMQALGGVTGAQEMPVDHKFADGVYVRTIFMPAGMVVVGRIHLRECVNIIISGTVVLMTVDGPLRLTGPQMFISPAGSKKVLYIETDTTWTTTHSLPPTDPDNIWDALSVPSFKQYAALQNERRQLEDAS